MFKVGDKVVLLRNEYKHKDLTEGKIYEIIGIKTGWAIVLDDVDETHYIDFESIELVQTEKQTSDGGSTNYYQFPEGATELFDLINHRNMNFAVGNIFKACYRMGEKDGINNEYDLRKIIFMAKQELKRIGGKLDGI